VVVDGSDTILTMVVFGSAW